jgi:hypothetical protein
MSCAMKDEFVEDFSLICLKKNNYKQTSLSPSNTKKIQCLLQKIHINVCERNCKVAYKNEGI